ncbi:uncharacterized protein NESG_00372 [Nematocida ausubeli]|uniref:RPN1 N-terminal domain-containing protein n=1 Tax=Nematocida ausubeli (strain ATCC PRA-371 / ERTm2) TaxID=1913371 RepID=A0A086J576_NEMA1|nr:uncharacterized protein NESG_00372 [Nematocida ausubeli]KAI5136054.1 26S proteasome regulatory subunit N1 [Nematocida ausubeli]KAI5148899.1 26S proteasome regulatory subunit N1 [Nematocida ausubeli]KFG27294.1 hypothetical protein NESG_00372 [Nematocida ausubeli]
MDSKTEEIHVILDSLSNTDPEITHSALSMLVQKMRASTSVASTIPQILLYLVSQRVVLQDKLVTLSGENRMLMADILSVISATLATTESLKYRLEGGATPMDIWGHQYVKKLSCDIVKSLKAHRMAGGSLGQEESNLSEMIATAAKESASTAKHSHGAENRAVGDEKVTEKEEVSEEEILPITEEMADPLEKVIEGVVECMFKFNCECDCVDFLLEIDRIEMILNYIDIDNQERIIRYLNALVYFVRNEKVTNTFLELLKRNGKLEEYAKLMIKERRFEQLLQEVTEFSQTEKIRIFYILGKHEVWSRVPKDLWDSFVQNMSKEKLPEGVSVENITSNGYMADLNRYVSTRLEMNKEVLGNFGSFSDALSKASFSSEILAEPENKKTYKITTQCSRGLLYLWDQKKALSELEEHIFSEDGYLKVSSILALATATCKVYDYNDTVLAAAMEAMDTKSVTQRIVVLISLAIKYAGTHNMEMFHSLYPLLCDDTIEIVFFTIYVIGNIFSGSCNKDIYTELLNVLASRIGGEGECSSPIVKFALLGVSLIFLQGEGKVTEVLDSCEIMEANGVSLSILLRSMAYMATGNTKVIHDILKDALDEQSENEQDYREMFGILGVALISLGDDTLVQMAGHILEGSMLLDSAKVQMAIPMAYSLLYLSTGKTEVIDTLRKSMHSPNAHVMLSAILGLGLVSAGTNNSRVKIALDEMSTFCGKGAAGSALKISQGLLRLGKGMHKLSLFNDAAISGRSVGCLLGFMMGALDGGVGILDRYYFVLMLIGASITPKYLIALNEGGSPTECNIRVGNKIDTAGVSGRPKTLAGVQVHASPVILQTAEGAEVLGDSVSYHTDGDVVIVSAPSARPDAEHQKE